MRKNLFTIATILGLTLTASAYAQNTPAPQGASVYFVNIENGAMVTSPFKVIFGLTGMGVAPAGTEKENTGHHHLFINRASLGQGPDGADELVNGIPADENHIHFGGGQTEKTIELPAGKHTLQMVLGDLNHVPHSPPIMSEVITITVQ
ncbi:MAG: DUF4399 domain-containing protein [Ahrensia sp.]|nr:DUF4399 domain-containing protein [Ahrensia sp.]